MSCLYTRGLLDDDFITRRQFNYNKIYDAIRNDVLLLSVVQFTRQKKQMSAGTHADIKYILYYITIISAGLTIGSDRPRLTGVTPWRVPKKYVIAKIKMNLYIYKSIHFLD